MESDVESLRDKNIGSPEGPSASSHILLAEYRMLGSSILIHEIVGRLFFSTVILVGLFASLAQSQLVIAILVLQVYGVFWLAAAYTAYRRQRFLSKLIAEESYLQAPEWGSLHIRSHYSQFDGQMARYRMVISIAEPFIWVMVAAVALAARAGHAL